MRYIGLVLLISMSGPAFAGGPAAGTPALACVKLESRAAGVPGCTQFVLVRNSCAGNVLAEVRTTQRLFSGTLSQILPVVVPAAGEQFLGCAWWSGAMAPSANELVGAQFLADPACP